MNKYIAVIASLLLLSAGCAKNEDQGFVKVVDGHFEIGGKPYYYIGTNFWYGAMLGSQGEGGDRQRLIRELDLMKSIGINNLRVLVGADGVDGVASKVEPALQTAPGVYNDVIFDGLDFLLSEMAARDMYAVLFLNNSWEWSGGYSAYLNWAGCGEIPMPRDAGWDAFSQYVGRYAQSTLAHQLFEEHIRHVIGRTNRYTGKKYADDKAIMSWQIANEPRPFGTENKEAFAQWIASAASVIRSIDSNHLISTGMEGIYGVESDEEAYVHIHSDVNIDYLTMHIWPNNWSWIDRAEITKTLPQALENTRQYLETHIAYAQKVGKPIVLEEFGLPRDSMSFTEGTATINRDKYYTMIFKYIAQNAKESGVLQGCNFWAWAGFARPSHVNWQKGDAYMGDPAQEEQGLNSVYDTDTTVDLIKKYNSMIHKDINE